MKCYKLFIFCEVLMFVAELKHKFYCQQTLATYSCTVTYDEIQKFKIMEKVFCRKTATFLPRRNYTFSAVFTMTILSISKA